MDFDDCVAAQDKVWPEVLSELRAGRKTSHWMWFVFPQHVALGKSAMARRFGLDGRDEAMAYLAHPVLGPRLGEALEAAMSTETSDPVEIFGPVDAMKLRSCLTLFAEVEGSPARFEAGLNHFFGGVRDDPTLDLLV